LSNITFNNVSKWYTPGQPVVRDLNLEIHDKEFLVIVGPSGCGKSTTLRMIAGLEDISTGELQIDSQRMNEVAPKDRDIAMVFQNYALYPHMTVKQNMAFGLMLRKVPKGEIETRVAEASRILGLESYLDRKPKELSGGQRQRVAVGRAIVRKPRVFLFDEPLSNLDAKMRVQTRGEIARLHRDLKATIVYVTHDQVEAMTLGTRIVVMNEGLVMQADTPLNLYSKPANKFVAGFIGSPAMNFIPGSIKSDHGMYFASASGRLLYALDATRFGETQPTDNLPVDLGVRPEHWQLTTADDAEALQLTVDVLEPLGSESFVYGSNHDLRIVVRVDGSIHPEVGSMMYVKPDPFYTHLFRATDGERI
jgi:multiple sugar transport system ATP-binding protein